MAPVTRRESKRLSGAGSVDTDAVSTLSIEQILDNFDQFRRKHIAQNRDIVRANTIAHMRIRELESRILTLEEEQARQTLDASRRTAHIRHLEYALQCVRVGWDTMGHALRDAGIRGTPDASASVTLAPPPARQRSARVSLDPGAASARVLVSSAAAGAFAGIPEEDGAVGDASGRAAGDASDGCASPMHGWDACDARDVFAAAAALDPAPWSPPRVEETPSPHPAAGSPSPHPAASLSPQTSPCQRPIASPLRVDAFPASVTLRRRSRRESYAIVVEDEGKAEDCSSVPRRPVDSESAEAPATQCPPEAAPLPRHAVERSPRRVPATPPAAGAGGTEHTPAPDAGVLQPDAEVPAPSPQPTAPTTPPQKRGRRSRVSAVDVQLTADLSVDRGRRARKSVNYALPKLNTKMRKPDSGTPGDTGDGSRVKRRRTGDGGEGVNGEWAADAQQRGVPPARAAGDAASVSPPASDAASRLPSTPSTLASPRIPRPHSTPAPFVPLRGKQGHASVLQHHSSQQMPSWASSLLNLASPEPPRTSGQCARPEGKENASSDGRIGDATQASDPFVTLPKAEAGVRRMQRRRSTLTEL
ncbi:hypothetical protein MSPP1_003967 [Malassezia sp. CBS 17886]|nr:hypothetical protein MSPP1_003967 [Malassezia sp. CBS 17886]